MSNGLIDQHLVFKTFIGIFIFTVKIETFVKHNLTAWQVEKLKEFLIYRNAVEQTDHHLGALPSSINWQYLCIIMECLILNYNSSTGLDDGNLFSSLLPPSVAAADASPWRSSSLKKTLECKSTKAYGTIWNRLVSAKMQQRLFQIKYVTTSREGTLRAL